MQSSYPASPSRLPSARHLPATIAEGLCHADLDAWRAWPPALWAMAFTSPHLPSPFPRPCSLVFGESVLNDAVAIVLYRTVRAFLDPTNPTSVGRGVLSFFIIFLGSMFIGKEAVDVHDLVNDLGVLPPKVESR